MGDGPEQSSPEELAGKRLAEAVEKAEQAARHAQSALEAYELNRRDAREKTGVRELVTRLAGDAEEAALQAQAMAAQVTSMLDSALATEDPDVIQTALLGVRPLVDTALQFATNAEELADAAEIASEMALVGSDGDAGVDELLRRLRRAVALSETKATDPPAIREHAAAAARLSQATGFALIQDYIRAQPETPEETREYGTLTALRAVAVLAALFLAGAAFGVYIGVEDRESSSSSGSTSGPSAAAAAAAPAPDTTTGQTTTGQTTTGQTTTGQTTTGQATTGQTTTDQTTTGQTTTAATAGQTVTSTDKRTHLSTVPIALLVAGTVILGLAIFAPRARSISASKEAIALNLDPNEDPFAELAKTLTTILAAAAPPPAPPGQKDDQPPGDKGKAGAGAELARVLMADTPDEALKHLAEDSPAGQHRMARPYGEGGMMILELDEPPRTQPPASPPLAGPVVEKALDAVIQASLAAQARQGRRRWWQR